MGGKPYSLYVLHKPFQISLSSRVRPGIIKLILLTEMIFRAYDPDVHVNQKNDAATHSAHDISSIDNTDYE